jgi:tRNA pseudouridine55 synthase
MPASVPGKMSSWLPGRSPSTASTFTESAGTQAAGHDTDVVDVDVTVECSSGTYIRALARDLGNSLGVGGHLTALRRTNVGPYSLDQARTLEQLAEDLEILEMSQAARALMPNRELSADETTEISFGRRIAAGTAAGTPGAATAEKPAAAFAPDGSLVALLADSGSFAKPVLVFAPGMGPGASNSSGADAGVPHGSRADDGGQG